MASSAGTPSTPSNSSEREETKSPPSSSSDLSSSSPPPPPPNSGSNNNSGGGGNKNSTAPSASPSPPESSPPPSPSPPPPSPPPPSSGSGGESAASKRSPPPKGSSPPLSSPPPPSSTSSSGPSDSPPASQSPPPPSNSAPADQSSKSPPSASGGQSAAAASPPPPPPAAAANMSGQSPDGSNAAPSKNAAADSGAWKLTPPAQPGSSTPTANSAPNTLSPPTASNSPTSKASPQGSSSNEAASSGNTPTASLSSASPSTSFSLDNQGTIIGAAVAGVFVVAIIAIFFMVRGRKKRRDHYGTRYMPPPNHFPEKADGYYYGQNYPPMGHSGKLDAYYCSQAQASPMGHSFGSQRGGNGYGGGPDSGVITCAQTVFTYEELMEITNGFSRDNVIGEGGFGYVYKGVMSNGKEVAVKQLKAGSGQGEREFRAEVEIISRVHHRHLVSLVGYCISDKNRLLIYEFLSNKTLEHHLHGKEMPVLEWSKRLKIALGAAKGLAYLHEDCHPKIIHRDIKSANILLDNDFEAQVADFGLARLNDTTQTHVSTRVMGTFGYLAPEYASSGKLTDRSDVFSFGVVLLELITGRKPVDTSQPLGEESLVEWARPHLVQAVETGNVSELVDPRLEKHYVESEMFRMVEAAAACVRHLAPKRPRMVQVVRALDCEGELSDLSNGVKYGESTMYDSGQYNQDILMFRKMVLGFDSGDMSGEYAFTCGESETRAMNQQSGDLIQSGAQGPYRF